MTEEKKVKTKRYVLKDEVKHREEALKRAKSARAVEVRRDKCLGTIPSLSHPLPYFINITSLTSLIIFSMVCIKLIHLSFVLLTSF